MPGFKCATLSEAVKYKKSVAVHCAIYFINLEVIKLLTLFSELTHPNKLPENIAVT